LGAFPRRAAQAIDRRFVCAGIFLNEVEPLDGHEQLVFTRVAELEEFLFAVGDTDFLQADEDADAVIDMDDVIADLEVAKIGEKGFRRAAPLRSTTLFFEDISL